MLDQSSDEPKPEANNLDLAGPDSPHFQLPNQLPNDAAAEKVAGWEQVGEGRFMPRRVRGSCHGRALG